MYLDKIYYMKKCSLICSHTYMRQLNFTQILRLIGPRILCIFADYHKGNSSKSFTLYGISSGLSSSLFVRLQWIPDSSAVSLFFFNFIFSYLLLHLFWNVGIIKLLAGKTLEELSIHINVIHTPTVLHSFKH